MCISGFVQGWGSCPEIFGSQPDLEAGYANACHSSFASKRSKGNFSGLWRPKKVD